ncbi:MAG: 23S rRNA (adenine(2503)-C(2))-methyltransferase RlmN [Fimbriimonadaceae bacterium]|nr:23S rRNA (adenine(2503)-C(2))-methyltransferase RlmN [Fimbriimonadaceae bacterium]
MADAKPALIGMDRNELTELVTNDDALGGHKAAKMRASQLAKWIYAKAVDDFDQMTDLPATVRERLKEAYRVSPLTVATHRTSTDKVQKLLVHNGDDQVYECVLLPYQDRVSCCLSSQVGCPMGCTFCATGLGGFDRNLSAGEIVGQYLLLQKISKDRISHVVFMGMGEPLLNLAGVLKTLTLMHEEIGLSYRHITISTVGIVPKIRELAKEKLPIHLALSLHSPIDEIRDRLMPVNHKWRVQEVVQEMRDYHHSTGRKVTFEYLLLSELTDTPEQARELAKLVQGLPCVVNVIPFNWVATEEDFKRPSRERVRAFKQELKNRGVNVTERMERGHDIAAACGQLAGQHKGKFARRDQPSALPLLS